MALPVPVIVIDQTVSERTKFMVNGMGFDRFVATWPTDDPPGPPDIDNSGDTTDPWRLGDNDAVASILYRVIENRSVLEAYDAWDVATDYLAGDQVSYEGFNYTATGNPTTGDAPGSMTVEWGAGVVILGVLPDSIRALILEDTVQRESAWELAQGTTDFYYQDVVFSGGDVDASTGRHEALMPTMDTRWAIDATTKCYWVTAWLGVDADNILIGYVVPP